jgi:hypothetical protein
MSNPATRAVPAVGGRSVVSMCTVVDLPAPFGPKKPKIAPLETNRSTPSTARGPFLYCWTSPSAWIVFSATPASLDRTDEAARRPFAK